MSREVYPVVRSYGEKMIEIKQGDITNPIWPETNHVIIHSCNDSNAMGSGVALALLKKWPEVKARYHTWANTSPHTFKLGSIQFVQVEPAIEVVNLIGQKSTGMLRFENLGVELPPVRYEALYEGFLRVRSELKSRYKVGNKWTEYTLHLPLISHGLAMGDFREVFKLYMKAFEGTDSRTCFYAYSDADYRYLENVYRQIYILEELTKKARGGDKQAAKDLIAEMAKDVDPYLQTR
jgi:hypothetical protein